MANERRRAAKKVAREKRVAREKIAAREKQAARHLRTRASSAATRTSGTNTLARGEQSASKAGTLVTVEEEISQTDIQSPHVVILGAGASVAACPHGDESGRKLPVMKNFLEVIDLGDLPEIENREDFELVYSKLVSNPVYADRCELIERTIYDYFAMLQLPPVPTIYDYLVLSLRPKDVIATFNWDPFLIQALRRCYRTGGMPTVLFLHGNVLAGYCGAGHGVGTVHTPCSVCKKPFIPSRLLYPVVEKNYDEDPLIRGDWQHLRHALRKAFMLTIFGYSAPKSDVAARELLLGAWGGSAKRTLEQIEIIDIRTENDLLSTWNDFIHTHHYDTFNDFFASSIARHPRRTGEAYRNQYIEARWAEQNPVPRGLSLEDLVKWYERLRSVES